jgi:hypothetical protein
LYGTAMTARMKFRSGLSVVPGFKQLVTSHMVVLLAMGPCGSQTALWARIQMARPVTAVMAPVRSAPAQARLSAGIWTAVVSHQSPRPILSRLD